MPHSTADDSRCPQAHTNEEQLGQTLETMPEDLIKCIVSLLSLSDFSNFRLASRSLRQQSLRSFAHRHLRTVTFGESPLQHASTEERLRHEEFCDAARHFRLSFESHVALPSFAPILGRLHRLESFCITGDRVPRSGWSPDPPKENLDQQWDFGHQLCAGLNASQAQLSAIQFDNCSVDPGFLHTLLIRLAPHLRALYLTGVRLKDHGIDDLLAYLRSMSLSRLSFENCDVGVGIHDRIPDNFKNMYRLPCTASGNSFKAHGAFRDPQMSGKIQWYRITSGLTSATGALAVKGAIEKMIEMRSR